MTGLSDDEVRRHLDRRLSGAPLHDPARYELIERISSRARAHPRQRLAGRRSTWRWLGAATAAGLALAVVAVVAQLPALDTAGPSGNVAVTPSAPLSMRVLLGSDLAALAHDPAQEGRVVIAQAEFAEAVCYGDCPPQVVLVADSRVKVVGLSRAPSFEVGAFRIGSGEVEVLGAVAPGPSGVRWTLGNVGALTLAADTRQDALYPVEGWLTETAALSCPGIPALFDDDPWNDRWYCEPSWLAPEPAYTAVRSGNAVVGVPLPDGSVVVQRGAYEDFAVDPQSGDRGAEPRFGVYLIRPDGCPPTVSGGDCPVWEMVARLDPVGALTALPTPSPSPTAPATQADILGAVARWVGTDLRIATDAIYVHTAVTEDRPSSGPYGPMGHDPESAVAGPPLFEGRMTRSTRQAVESALRPLRAEFVANPQDVVNREGVEHLGCRPYLGGHWLLGLGPPHVSADGGSYFVLVDLDRGCEGRTYVVEVTATEEGYEVTRVVHTGNWAV